MPELSPASIEETEEPLRVVRTTGDGAGDSYTGWTRVSVTRTLDQAAARFTLSAGGSVSIPVRPLDGVEIWFGNWLITRGFVEEAESHLGKDQRSIRVAGRDLLSDLIDSSADIEPGVFTNATLDEIVRALLEPFSASYLQLGPPGDPFPNFELQRGESPYSAIERAARSRGLLAYSTPRGGLVLTPPATETSGIELIQGGQYSNVLALKLKIRSQDRYSLYRVKGQRRGNSDDWGEAVAHIEGVARDEGVDRYRPLVVVAEQQSTSSDAQARAEWESAYRYARGVELQATVQGWINPQGRPWELNQIVSIWSGQMGIRTEMLIDGITMRRDPQSGGTTTVLRLVRKDAYRPEPNRDDDGPDLESGWLNEEVGR
ncbi:MAG: phage baseplate assembly protein [Planctomycetota bacterium]